MNRFFNYFKILFIITAIIAVICIGIRIAAGDNTETQAVRHDQSDLTGNVFDYAGALGDAYVSELDKYITQMEDQVGCDIAVIVLDESLEGRYSTEASRWVREYAKGFVLNHNMGYDKGQGESIVFIDNLYREPSTGRVYSFLFTWGYIEDKLTTSSCEDIMNIALANLSDDSKSSDYFIAYKRVIELLPSYINKTDIGAMANNFRPSYIIAIAFTIAVIYILVNWKSKIGVRTTISTTYVENGKPNISRQQDIFLRKSVSKRKIQKSSSGGGGGHGGGGGGHSR